MFMLQVQDNPHSTTRQIGIDFNLSHTSVRNILQKQKFHVGVWTLNSLQKMSYEGFGPKATKNIRNILFTDESSFALHGRHNSSITRYWSQENKHLSVPLRTQYPQKVNVWAGILGDSIIGPFFIDGNPTARKYLNLLRNEIIPTVQALDINLEEIWYQQDGCRAHNARELLIQI
ncbi:hypothetical protein NQ318_009652 [Aromia moschata]|uniref:Transposase n=1 Tax=Aromia moschata TaxID=1265417 RepID=A0AAV8XYS1_9CUCU|nr:hypothetical protein NQ318_009652 [Aromia moschata]